jgi:hypothetical protein
MRYRSYEYLVVSVEESLGPGGLGKYRIPISSTYL